MFVMFIMIMFKFDGDILSVEVGLCFKFVTLIYHVIKQKEMWVIGPYFV